MSKTWYTGIADSEGIESFMPLDEADSQQTAMWTIRAAANSQRFAIVYKAELDNETATNVKRWLKEENWVNALRAMSSGIKQNKLEAEATNKKYWKTITNASLMNKLKEINK